MDLHIRLADRDGQDLAGFPWLDLADVHLSRLATSLRVATIETPFSDVDQGWETLSWADESRYFVLTGAAQPPGPWGRGTRAWLRVFRSGLCLCEPKQTDL